MLTHRYDYAFDPAGDSTAAQVARAVGDEKHVLELGCGPGAITRVLSQHYRCKVVAVEQDPEAAKQAAPHCTEIHLADLDHPDALEPLAAHRFDVIVMADVLEHLRDPVAVLRNAIRLLSDDGYCVISVPNIAHNGVIAALLGQTFPYSDTGLLDRTHIRFFARNELPKFLAQAGLLLGRCDNVCGAPAHTEFAYAWYQLGQKQRQMLQAHPEGNTYQFVLIAWPDTPINRLRLVQPTPLDNPRPNLPSEARQLLRHLHELQLYQLWKLTEGRASWQDQTRQLERIQLELDQSQRQLAHVQRRLEQVQHQLQSQLNAYRDSPFAKFTHLLWRVKRRLLGSPWPLDVGMPVAAVEPQPSVLTSTLLPCAEITLDIATTEAAVEPKPAVPTSTPLPCVEITLDQRVSLTLAQYDQAALPLLTIIIDVGDHQLDSHALLATVHSVQAQTYANLQLLFTQFDLESLHTQLTTDAPFDTRWRALPSRGTANAVRLAADCTEGELAMLLKPGDQLTPAAVQELADIFQRQPSVQLLTFDHWQSNAITPTRLPGWSHEFHLAQNAVGRSVVWRAETLRAALQAVVPDIHDAYTWMWSMWATIGEAACAHHSVPCLRHGSSEFLSTSDAKPHIQKAVSYKKNYTQVVTGEHGLLRLRHAVPSPAPLVSILVPTRNAAHLLHQCVNSVLDRSSYSNYELILIDNGSDQADALALLTDYARHPKVRVLRDDSPFNFSALNNRAATTAKGDLLLLLNNDTEVITPDWLEIMVSYAIQPENGAVGARLWYPTNHLQHGGVVMTHGAPNHAYTGLARGQCGPLDRACITQRYLAVTAACLMVRKTEYWRVGGLDEQLSVAFNDVDFCLRLHESGLRNLWVAQVDLYHHESPTRGADATPQKKARAAQELALLQHRWSQTLLTDQFCQA